MTQSAKKTPKTPKTPKAPVKLTVPAKNKSAKMTDEQLLKMGQLCLLQGTKKLGTKSCKEALCDLLCCGLEGGYGSITIDKFNKPPKMTFRTDLQQVYRHLDYPMNEGGSLEVFDKYEYYDGVQKESLYRYVLDYKALLIGLARMSLDHPHSYANWIGDNADALTGDALIQCALFGDIVYG